MRTGDLQIEETSSIFHKNYLKTLLRRLEITRKIIRNFTTNRQKLFFFINKMTPTKNHLKFTGRDTKRKQMEKKTLSKFLEKNKKKIFDQMYNPSVVIVPNLLKRKFYNI